VSMAASIPDQILAVVEQWNDEGREICQKDLESMKIAAVPTLNKYVNELIEDGLLRWEAEQTEHGTRKNLYVSTRSQSEYLKRREVYYLGRIAAALEKMVGDTSGIKGERRERGRYKQQRLK